MIIKYRGILLLIIGSILIGISIFLAFYSRIDLLREQLFSEIDYMINNNSAYCNCVNEEMDNSSTNDDLLVDINTDYIEIESNQTTNNKPGIKKEYIGYLSIPRISLRYGFGDIGSYYNHVDRNIQIISQCQR